MSIYIHFSIIMTKRTKSKMCLQKEINKTTNTNEVPIIDTIKLESGSASPQCSYNVIVSGHSTPIQKEKYTSNAEDSPELDYRYSPISMRCTQDGGNEVAWEWHTPVKKGSKDKRGVANNLIETPKRTKQLQKKRNSNSPLLRKPLKMKQVKITDTEDIGKFAAELIALNEKIGSIQQTCSSDGNNEIDIKHELDSKLMIQSDGESDEDMMVDEDVDRFKVEVKEKIDPVHTINNNNVEKHKNYQDLFDDSIEDSMVKCSQEIEEKFNMQRNIKPDLMLLATVSEEKESFESGSRHSTFNTFIESSKSSIFRVSSSNTSCDLKTYSNSSTSKLSNFFNHSKPFTNITANMVETDQMSVASRSKSKSNDFPDDSFDDCLVTCTVKEESKSPSDLSVYDFCTPGWDQNHSDSCKVKCSKPIKNQRVSNRGTSTVPPRESPTTLENRKFFKTRSLSDQCSNQSKVNINLAATKVKTERSSVSSEYPNTSDKNSCENDNFPATKGTENAKTLTIRPDKRLSTHFIVKSKSTGNLLNNKQINDSNRVKCTPEEIERKRLEAKMRLEAKRKSQQMKVINNPSGVNVKR